MSQLDESSSLDSISRDSQRTSGQNETRGQNIVSGTVANGGTVIQGDNTQFTQNIYQTPSGEDLSAHKISKKFRLEPGTIPIPAGKFIMRSKPEDEIPEYEKPLHEVDLPLYRIGKYPVTNEQYAKFMRETGKSVLEIGWKSQKIPADKKDHPVTGVNWYDALAYCKWLKEKTGRNYTLPNEAQWEKACRGKKYALESKKYPWGDEFDGERCNQGQSGLSAVNKYLQQNDYGCFDFVGNVLQWTCSLWGTDYEAPDPEYFDPRPDDDCNEMGADRRVQRVLRGSSFADERGFLRCSYKRGASPEDRGHQGSRYGFRVAITED